MIDLIGLRSRPPRWDHNIAYSHRARSKVLLIDWLDSRPEHVAKDNAALSDQISRGDLVAWTAAVITKRVAAPQLPLFVNHGGYLLAFTGAYQNVVGYLDAEELPFGEHTYRRLHDIDPDCISALINFAEVERRAGRETAAQRLLDKALVRASSPTTKRYGFPDSHWEIGVRCALARLSHDVGDGGPLLENANSQRLANLIALLRNCESPDNVAIAANHAFSVASTEQRIVLDVAMEKAGVPQRPPPSAHVDYDRVIEFANWLNEQKNPSEFLFTRPSASVTKRAVSTEDRPIASPSQRVPADQGLSGLGLLMQFGGGLMASIALTLGFLACDSTTVETHPWSALFLLALSCGRSLLQRRAGTVLLYGPGLGKPPQTRTAENYIKFAFVHSIVASALLHFEFEVTWGLTAGIVLALAAWPAILASFFALPRFRRLRRTIPRSDDQSFKGATIYATVFGLLGAISTAVVFLMINQDTAHGRWQASTALLAAPALVVLLARSILHVRDAFLGLSPISIDPFVTRRAQFAVTVSFTFLLGLLVLHILLVTKDIARAAICTSICWGFLLWPVVLRRFVAERQYAYFLSQYRTSEPHRGQNAGLTSLGWLLVGTAAFIISFLLPHWIVVVTSAGELGRNHALYGFLTTLRSSPLSSVWQLPVVALELWAGCELVRMSPYAKIVASFYGAAAIVIAVGLWWSRADAPLPGSSGLATILQFAPHALWLILPITTLILINRRLPL